MASVRLAVDGLAGVGNLSWDQERRILEIGYELSALTVEKIRQALEAVGFESMPVDD